MATGDKCEICEGKTELDHAVSESLALSILQFALDRDDESVTLATKSSTQFDYHVLCGAYLHVLQYCAAPMLGYRDFRNFLKEYRGASNAVIAQAAQQ